MFKKIFPVLLVVTLVLTGCAGGIPMPPGSAGDDTGSQPTAVVQTSAPSGTTAGSNLPTVGSTFKTPVVCKASFNTDAAWLICEPGVINDNTTAWTIGQTKTTYYQNVPEGAFAYFSLGEGIITIDGVNLVLKGEKGLNYLVVIRGRIDDTIVDSDLNLTAEVNEFVPGHAIWSYMPKGAYVSMDWFRQQLVASTTESFTNCGATGCSRVRIVLYDVDSKKYQLFETHAGSIDTWTLVESN